MHCCSYDSSIATTVPKCGIWLTFPLCHIPSLTATTSRMTGFMVLLYDDWQEFSLGLPPAVHSGLALKEIHVRPELTPKSCIHMSCQVAMSNDQLIYNYKQSKNSLVMRPSSVVGWQQQQVWWTEIDWVSKFLIYSEVCEFQKPWL